MSKRNSYYMHQQFMICEEANKVTLSSLVMKRSDLDVIYEYSDPPNLFDSDHGIIRKVALSHILEEIDTLSDWVFFLEKIKFVDDLIIILDITPAPLKVLQQYYADTLRAIAYRLTKENKRVMFIDNCGIINILGIDSNRVQLNSNLFIDNCTVE